MKSGAAILVVDDERGMRDLLSGELGARGYRVSAAADGREAVEKMRREKFSLVVSDVRMPGMSGIELVEEVKRIDSDVEVILSTGYGTIETAVAAMKLGAYDYIQKPFNLDELTALVEKALERGEIKAMLAVYESSRDVFSSLDLDTLLPITARLAARALRADHVEVLLAEAGGALSLSAEVGPADAGLRREFRAMGEREVAGAAPEAESAVVLIPGEAGGAVVCPLVVAGEKLGVLIACRVRSAKPFSGADLRCATVFGAQIAQAIGNAKMYRELEKRLREIQEMQGRLIQSEKLAAIGQLAAGVAHEINNPLTSVMGLAELLLQGGGLSSGQQDDVRGILGEARRCQEIVRGLLQFGRKREPKKEPVKLAHLLDTTLRLSRHALNLAGVEVVKSIPDGLPPVLADPVQLEQVFLNLVANAGQALAGRPGARLSVAARRDGGRVVLRFSDNGPGIAPENLGRIFEPFFTTKPAGQGTGLGLSISRGLVEQNGGTIDAESRAGEGATFVLTLPTERTA